VAYQNVRQPAPFLLARQQGKNAVFVSVLSFGDAPVKTGAVKVRGDTLTVPLPGGGLVFDFNANKVTRD
jgi:hypothetical protein